MAKLTCTKCGDTKQETAFRACGSKRLADGFVRLYRSEHCRRCDRQIKIERGLCICSQPLANGKTSCERCLKAVRDSVHTKWLADRNAAITHYGGSCAYCGESIEVFLTFDHVNDDGGEFRKQKNGTNRGLNMGRWLRQNNYPANIQLLCSNCNSAKAKIGATALITLLRERGRLRSDYDTRRTILAST